MPSDQAQSLELPSLPEELKGIATLPRSAGFPLLRSSYMKIGSPALILKPRNEQEVSASVLYSGEARARHGDLIPLSVRSGGHSISGQSTNNGGIIIDLSDMRRIEVVDVDKALVRIEPGAVWGEVAAELGKHELVLTSGNFGGTGVGGLAGAGGLGYFARHQGMTVDRIRGARLVTADGVVHDVSATSEPDLFWAVRGGAGQIGIVTEFVFEAEHLPRTETIQQQVKHVVDDLPGFVERWGNLLRNAPREFTSFLMITYHRGTCVSSAQNVWWGSDVEKAKPTLQAFSELGPMMQHSASVSRYSEVVIGERHANVGQQTIRMRDGLVDRVDRHLGEALCSVFKDEITAVVELRSLGGAINQTEPLATAYPHRHQEALVAFWYHPVSDKLADDAWKSVHDLSTGIYSFYSSDTRPSAAALSWPGETGERLRRIAQKVDPSGLFTHGLSVRSV